MLSNTLLRTMQDMYYTRQYLVQVAKVDQPYIQDLLCKSSVDVLIKLGIVNLSGNCISKGKHFEKFYTDLDSLLGNTELIKL